MAKTEEGKIKKIPGTWRCPDCGGEHEFYRRVCPLKSQTVKLRQVNAELRQKCEQLERKQACFDRVVELLAETIDKQGKLVASFGVVTESEFVNPDKEKKAEKIRQSYGLCD